MQAVKVMSEPTSLALWAKGEGCLSSVRTNLPGTEGQECGLFRQCLNLTPGHCWAGMGAVLAVSEPNSQVLWGRGAGCLSGVGTYLPGTVRQGCRLFKHCQNLPPGHVRVAELDTALLLFEDLSGEAWVHTIAFA